MEDIGRSRGTRRGALVEATTTPTRLSLISIGTEVLPCEPLSTASLDSAGSGERAPVGGDARGRSLASIEGRDELLLLKECAEPGTVKMLDTDTRTFLNIFSTSSRNGWRNYVAEQRNSDQPALGSPVTVGTTYASQK